MNMKRILILIIGLFGVAQAQFAPTSAKTAFKNGISVGTRDSTAYNSSDSLVVVINRQGRLMYRSTDGYWKLLANAASSDYVPYTGAVDNVALGNFRLTARSIKTDSIYANSSAGMYLTTNSGTAVAHWGAGGSVEVDFKGFAGYDANRSASYTARSFTDKNYVDSSDALRVRYTDTAAMLNPYLRKSDTATMLSPYRRTSTKITNSDLVNSTISGVALGSNLNNLNFGNGFTGAASYNGSSSQSIRVDTFTISTKANVTGLLTGYATTSANALKLNISDTSAMLSNYARKSGDTFTGSISGTSLSMSSSGAAVSISNSSDLWYNITRGTNFMNIGLDATGSFFNSNTSYRFLSQPAIFSSSVTANSLVKSGGTSSQFLKADGSVDGNTYLTSASITGKLNISDTLTMLSPYLRKSDTTTMLNGYARSGNLGSYAFRSSGLAELSGATFTGSNAAVSISNSSDLWYNITRGTNFMNIGLDATGSFFNSNTSYRFLSQPAIFSSSVTASSFIRSGGTSSQSLMADGSVQTVTSGSYTPTITNTTNVASSTPQVFYYTRVGNIVTVTGWVGIDITSNETSTVLGISLPIASTVNSFDKVIGIGNFYIGVSGAQVGKIEADTTNNRATLTFYPYFGAADGTVNTSIQFSYLVN